MLLKQHKYIKTRRNGSKIYKSEDGNHFIKAGSHNPIHQESELYNKLSEHGIQLPTIISVETIMIEQSFGEKTFADLFTDSYKENLNIKSELFEDFLRINKIHIDGQIKLIDKDITTTKFSAFDALIEEKIITENEIKRIKNKTSDILSNIPLTRNHGDYNPYNIFPKGVIDLEDGFLGPLGYDTITAITQNYRFPDEGDYELHRQHIFSKKQLLSFLEDLSKNSIGLNFLSKDIFASLFIMRGAFVTAGSSRAPKSQDYRYNLFKSVIEKYLKGDDILEFFLSTYHKR